ncbi:methylase involved in ubiquinone/menaquinone biosynthesis [Rubidibacter lacunae KORDI 51-2]|uniref:Methylase involved in ubiquinone/menaquinone biosynthesis n=1 Tax=Rubidibacter lacunae KORDI 51-2 TaxID=582515 RepID=U5DNB5_9CHRO|nr:class I SAM-dependent methyltransferase [Rubidibacter lacunae]ERN43151.1 methylase involved in ubiquinone/menaquinone biosynthesis [Rubidibacter lacunae KORDI 51-2]
MTSTPNIDRLSQALNPLLKSAYDLLQQSKAAFALAHKTTATRLAKTFSFVPKPDTVAVADETFAFLQQRLERLQSADWHDAECGVYPKSLLFDNPWLDFLTLYPALVLDLPNTWECVRNRRYQDVPADVSTEGYPKYYLQKFHNQTDGYLSDSSAELYDLQVELLFNGSADAMRRRILAPLKQGLEYAFAAVPQSLVRVLDVACGTGRTLRMLRAALSQASLYGTDLSPAYLRKANALMSELPGELPQLLQANAEQLPYADSYFHGITCVFSFHELPGDARQNVINEIYRVLQPGGTFVICDSVQAIDSPEMLPLMKNFPATFHEPYYKHYITDNLEDRLRSAGFEVESVYNYLASKYWVARKPF